MEGETSKGKIAVVRVRGQVNLRHDVKTTFEYLKLNAKNWCVILDNTPANVGMITKVKDYVTWGNVSDETVSEVVAKRGKETKDENSLTVGGKKYFKFLRMNSPRKGFGRGGVKISFKEGGALGNRGDAINDLLKRMI